MTTADETGAFGWFARVFRRVFHTPESPDRGFYRAVGAMALLGLVASAAGVWAVVQPSGWQSPVWWRVGAGIVIGPMFLFFALGALVRRWRQGPQPPGRHTHD